MMCAQTRWIRNAGPLSLVFLIALGCNLSAAVASCPDEAVVFARIQGDACQGEFDVRLAVDCNESGVALGSWSVRLEWPEGIEFVSLLQGDFPAPPMHNLESATSIAINAFNVSSTFENGWLATLRLRNSTAAEGPLLIERYGATGLVLVDFTTLAHRHEGDEIACETTPADTALISLELAQGDPTQPGNEFTLALRVDNNQHGPVGSYSFLLAYDTQVLTFVDTLDAGDGFATAPGSNTVQEGVRISASNVLSTLDNGALAHVVLRTAPALPPAFEIVSESVGLTPLVGTDFETIDHEHAPALRIDADPDAPTSTPTMTPTSTATFTQTPTLTPAATHTHTPTPHDNQTPRPSVVVALEPDTGDPCVDEAFRVAVVVRENTGTAVGTYAVRVTFDPNVLVLSRTTAGDFSNSPGSSMPEPGVAQFTATNVLSTMVNGRLCVIEFEVSDPGAALDIDIVVEPFGADPLVGTDFRDIPAVYDSSATTGLCPSVVSFRWGDLNDDGVVGVLDASLLLRWDAFTIDAFPCCPQTLRPDFPQRADLNGDGVAGTLDASLVLRFDTLALDCFPVDADCDGFGP